jgi:hypothetical protein
MLAYRVPYPRKEETNSSDGPFSLSLLKAYEFMRPFTLDFPDRHISYILVGCAKSDLPRYREELPKAVAIQEIGNEPAQLVL